MDGSQSRGGSDRVEGFDQGTEKGIGGIMAKGDITIKASQFFTDTRMRLCWNEGCRFCGEVIDGNKAMTCQLKQIDIDENGKCFYGREPKPDAG